MRRKKLRINNLEVRKMINVKTVFGLGVVLLIAAISIMWIGCADKPADKSEPAPAVSADEAPVVTAAEYVCPMHPDERSTDPDATCGICGMKLEPGDEVMKDKMMYVCPMHPDERSTDPDATCGICGMNLEPSEEKEPEHMEGEGHGM